MAIPVAARQARQYHGDLRLLSVCVFPPGNLTLFSGAPTRAVTKAKDGAVGVHHSRRAPLLLDPSSRGQHDHVASRTAQTSFSWCGFDEFFPFFSQAQGEVDF